MSEWFHLKHRKPVPFKFTINEDTKGFAKESNKFFHKRNKNRFIRRKFINEIQVSTIFLGLDHSFDDKRLVLFETMIFGLDDDSYQVRASTHRQALKNHQLALTKVKEALK